MTFEPMSRDAATEIADWRYEPPFDFYDLDADAADRAEFLDEVNWRDSHFAARAADGELLGFFIYQVDGSTATIGLGLHPDHTSRGLGTFFVAEGMEFGRQRFGVERYRVEVAEFNTRAINVYRRLRFRLIERFNQATNGGVYPFVRMEAPAVRRGACILMVDGDRVALQLRDNKPFIGNADRWGVFGGGVEDGEEPGETILREMQEELRVELDPERLRLAMEFTTPAKLRSTVFVYELNGELADADLQEGQRFGQFGPDDVVDGHIEGKRVIPYHLEIVKAYWAGRLGP